MKKFQMPAWPIFLGFIGILIGIFHLIVLWTERNIEFWASRSKGMPVDVPYWLAFLFTFVLNGFAVLFNVIAEILKYVL